MKKRKHINIVILLVLSIFFIPTLSFAKSPATVEGTFQGSNCVFFLKKCPGNMSNPHIATEPDFVIVEKSGKYYYVTNLDRAIKAQYIGKPARVIGKIKDQSIIADSLEVKIDGKFKEVWNLKDEIAEKNRKYVDW